MPFLEYMLLAFLGSAPATIAGSAPTGAAPTRTFIADAVTQPGGGTAGELSAGGALVGQDTGGSKGRKPETGKKPLEHTRTARHHKRSHSHKGGSATSGKKATKS